MEKLRDNLFFQIRKEKFPRKMLGDTKVLVYWMQQRGPVGWGMLEGEDSGNTNSKP